MTIMTSMTITETVLRLMMVVMMLVLTMMIMMMVLVMIKMIAIIIEGIASNCSQSSKVSENRPHHWCFFL